MVEVGLSQLIANLDMYAWPENQPVWERLWALTREALAPKGEGRAFDCPKQLSRFVQPDDAWLSPDLLLGHTCGFPYVSRLRDQVALVGVFDHKLPDCAPGEYYSVFISGKKPAGRIEALASNLDVRVAVNGFDSQSGWRVLREIGICEPQKVAYPERFIITGSHRESIQAVAGGAADFAAIDAVTFRLAQAFEPDCAKVEVIGRSKPAPALPLITAGSRRLIAPNLKVMLQHALHDLSADEKAAIGVFDVLGVEDAAYAHLA